MVSPRGRRVLSSPQAVLSWAWVRPWRGPSRRPEKFAPVKPRAREVGALQIGPDEGGVGQVGAGEVGAEKTAP